MFDESHFEEMSGAAMLLLDRASDRILRCNPGAALMLAQTAEELRGSPWWESLGVPHHLEHPLGRALLGNARTTLSPVLLHPPRVGELVVGGYIFSQQYEGRDAAVLVLFRLASSEARPFASEIETSDVVAVLGIDRPRQQAVWQHGDMVRRMIDVRCGLQQIVPVLEDVGMPCGSTIPVALRDVTLERSRDICRALLSHLTPLLGQQFRIRIGLAQRLPGESPLATLVAANDALLQLQRSGTAELISGAAGDDSRLPVPAVEEGIFGELESARESQSYFRALAALTVDPHQANAWLAQVVGITLQQRNIAAIAIYRRRYDDSFEFVTGGFNGAENAARVGETQLPRPLRQLARKLSGDQLLAQDQIGPGRSSAAGFPLRHYDRLLGCMLLQYREPEPDTQAGFTPGVAALHQLVIQLSALAEWRQAGAGPAQPQPAAPRPMEDRIDGYVGDNMEGAIDQAIFLAGVDVPVAIIGPRGTGKLYVAKVIHQESGAEPEQLITIDCRAFRSRKDALGQVARELARSAGKTLVFKSPHLMHADAQLKLAKQISSRILADTSPPRYLPAARIIGLFPDSLEHLVRHGGLSDRLASVFAAYPIKVPPIKDRKRAVLRWAHKILVQEAARRDRKVTGFTPDAEQAMLQHDWPGNISEMRQCIVSALDKSDKEWLTPVDLGIFKGLSPTGNTATPEKRAFLQVLEDEPVEEPAYSPTTREELGVALGEAVHGLLELDAIKPLGAWLDDEVILAACERYRDNMRAAADFLQTKPRNIGRWMPKILSRDHERNSSSLWQTPHRLIRQWIRETAPMSEPPQQVAHGLLLSHVADQCAHISVADRARIMGVSTPTYQKRLQDIND